MTIEPSSSKITIRLLAVVWLTALAGLWLTPHDPLDQQFMELRLTGFSLAHPLGVDGLGRDALSRVWRGAGHTVLMGTVATALCLALSLALLMAERLEPVLAGRIICRVVSVWIAMPVLLVALLLLVFLAPSPGTLVLAAGLGNVPLVFRQSRVLWLEQSRAEHIRASEVLGAGRWRLVWHGIWPNLRPDAAALLRIVFALSVLELSGLAFLGLIGDPDFPELGLLLRENQRHLFQLPSLVIWPGVVLMAILLLSHGTGSLRPHEGSR